MEIPFYVGCYAPKGQDSLFAYCLNTQTGSVTQTHTCAEVENPSYLALSSDGETLYAVSETETFQGQAGGGFAALSCKNSFSVYGQSATRGTFPATRYLRVPIVLPLFPITAAEASARFTSSPLPHRVWKA